jgi:hypothetical protein
MPKFDLKKIDAFEGKQQFYQLTIDDTPNYSNLLPGELENDRKTGVLDEYEAQLQTQDRKDLASIYAYMERISNNQHVDGTKYHTLGRPSNDPYTDFEFKKGKLRVYGIQTPDGKVIVLGGFKKKEDANIKRLRSLKKQYFDSLKNKK